MNFNNNNLQLDDVVVTTKYSIKKVLETEEKYIVLQKIPRVELGYDEINNILCYDKCGNILWQISNKLPASIASSDQVPYVDIRMERDSLLATDFWGRRFTVNIETGYLEDVVVVK